MALLINDEADDLVELLRDSFTINNASKRLTRDNKRDAATEATTAPDKPLNKRQREKGVLRSSAVEGLVEFSKLTPIKDWRVAIATELRARGVVLPDDAKKHTQKLLREAFKRVLQLADGEAVVFKPETDGFCSLFTDNGD